MEKKITYIPAKKGKGSARSDKSCNDILRVAAYCRVSTDHEEQQSSFENQVDYYTKLIARKTEYELAGIYADEGITATNTRKRDGFNRMMADCDAGKIDLIITKSISRFARNTQDCLKYTRHLKELGVNVIFEKENISTMDSSGELLFTILSSLAQEESRNISENCKWAIRHNFKKGKPTINIKRFTGYDRDENGKLVINKEQAAIVRRIYTLFEEGFGYMSIGKILSEEGIKGLFAEGWHSGTIRHMLENEKYCGDLLMQKYYVEDYLTKKLKKNKGERDMYFVADDHEAIIPKDEWNAVQMEIKRRYEYMEEANVHCYGPDGSPFTVRVLCGQCGEIYRRNKRCNKEYIYWICANKRFKKGCKAENINEDTLYKVFQMAWNSIWYRRDEYMINWNRQIKEGNPLERLRAKQMIELMSEGKLEDRVPELVRMTLERIIVYDKTHFEVRFLDGTIKNIRVSKEQYCFKN